MTRHDPFQAPFPRYGHLEVAVAGDGSFYVSEVFEVLPGANDMIFRVPVGFRTDFASIPWFGRFYFRSWGPHTKAAVFHDFCYRHLRHLVTKAWADRVFYDGMANLGVSDFTRTVFYVAVRLAFWQKW